MSDQNKISFLNEEKSSETSKKVETKSERTIQQLADAQRSKKLDNKYNDSGIMNRQSIFSARTGIIKDEGGPTKYTKSESSNTTWDSDKTARSSQEIDSKTKTIQDKAAIADNKRHDEKKRMDTMVEALRGTDQTKASAISPASTYSGSNYKTPSKNMSIFDTKDFERLQEKTAGEKVTEENNARKDQKDDSWRGGGKSVKASEIVSEYFNSLLKKRDA